MVFFWGEIFCIWGTHKYLFQYIEGAGKRL
jgi:hypothetical protein